MLSALFANLLNRLRPNSRIAESIAKLGLRRVLGWYMRKAAIPSIIGLFAALRMRKSQFPIFVGRSVRIAYASHLSAMRGASIGANSRILALSERGVILGSRVTIREGAWIQCAANPANPGVSLSIGSDTYIGPNSIIGVGGPIDIGRGCQLGAGVTLISENHRVEGGLVSASEVSRKGIVIGDGVWIGHRATILDGVTLGDMCVVGAGAVVTKSFPPRSTIVGVPGRAYEASGR